MKSRICFVVAVFVLAAGSLTHTVSVQGSGPIGLFGDAHDAAADILQVGHQCFGAESS